MLDFVFKIPLTCQEMHLLLQLKRTQVLRWKCRVNCVSEMLEGSVITKAAFWRRFDEGNLCGRPEYYITRNFLTREHRRRKAEWFRRRSLPFAPLCVQTQLSSFLLSDRIFWVIKRKRKEKKRSRFYFYRSALLSFSVVIY